MCRCLRQLLRELSPDYKQALSEKDEGTIRECERFLRSQWFAFLSDLDGEKLIVMMKEEAA